MPKGIAPLVAADEYLNHQIVNTFGAVGTSDLSWTEKVWGTFAARDGSLQVDLGLGKYVNRNVLDGFAGVARGKEQWTIRSSRDLSAAPDDTSSGPISYEVVEPLKKVRFALRSNDVQPISFDLEFEGVLPHFFEDRDIVTERGRTVSDVIRYHTPGTVTGWVQVEGDRHEVDPSEWYGFRDRSWGVRQYVGQPVTDIQPTSFDYLTQRFHFNWLVSQMVRPDGSMYELQYYFRETDAGILHLTGHINEADGSQTNIVRLVPELRYSSRDRSLVGGCIRIRTEDAPDVDRIFEIEPLSSTGFHLHPALYAPWKGLVHGTWKGAYHEDGEYISDCEAEIDAVASPAWQLRDRPIRLREGSATGLGILESVIIGEWQGRLTS